MSFMDIAAKASQFVTGASQHTSGFLGGLMASGNAVTTAAGEAVAKQALAFSTAFNAKSISAEDGAAVEPMFQKMVDKLHLPNSPQKTELQGLVDKLANGGWDETANARFHEIYDAVKPDPKGATVANTDNTVR